MCLIVLSFLTIKHQTFNYYTIFLLFQFIFDPAFNRCGRGTVHLFPYKAGRARNNVLDVNGLFAFCARP